ncbi:MAG TPA: FG-GAP-like repeat-containing protein, partial [Pyrinomonadaceae bacterium]|nr:FG-GAP-like repeat-containing protein [Pyrinomonadaceae bacterium]
MSDQKSSAAGGSGPAPQDFVLQFQDNDVLVADQSPLLNLGNQYTLEAWVYVSTAHSGYSILLGKVNGSASSDPFLHYVLGINGEGKLDYVQSTGQPGSFRSAVSPNPLPLRQWLHVAGTTEGNTLKLFINGQEIASNFSVGPPAGADVPFTVGGGIQGFGGENCCNFIGYIRQARVWNRPLSGAELSTNSSVQLSSGTPNLIAQWMLSEGSGQSTADTSGNALSLQLGTSTQADANDPRWMRTSIVDQGPYFVLEPFQIDLMNVDTSAGRLFDFDLDGDLDVLDFRFNANPGPTYALRNNGQGQFENATSAVLDPPTFQTRHPRGFAVADFNGDGKKDFFIGDHGFDQPPFPGGQSQLLIQTATGLADETSTRLPQKSAGTHDVTAADIEGDGDIDLYLANIGCGCDYGPELYINDGTGHFIANTSRLPEFVTSRQRKYTASAFMDVDNDGDSDLFLGAHNGSGPNEGGLRDTILINNGSGFFSEATHEILPPRIGGTTWGTVGVEVADFNNDGLKDLLLSVVQAAYNSGKLQLLLNNGNGTFRDSSASIPQPFADGENGWTIWTFSADFNSDGRLDVVTSSYTSESHLYLNAGGARFVDATDILPYRGPLPTALPGDLDSDGDRDIFGLSWGGRYYVLRNVKPFRLGNVPFDFDGDGKADTSVYRPGEGNWYVYGSEEGYTGEVQWGVATDRVVAADYDGDGRTDHAVYRDGTWWVMGSNGGASSTEWGIASDVPVPADYDGDGKADMAVYR